MAKKEGIRRLFNKIAPDYDRLNHILSLNIDRRWRRKAVRRLADTSEPLRVLDVACGTGDFTIAIARKLPQGSVVVGVDISEGMLVIGREKVARAGIEADMLVADCEALPYNDGEFDRIAVGFGVRNFENLERGLGEMFRVLRPGGKLVILELSIPQNPLIRGLYKWYFLKVLPVVGGWLSGERGAYEYLPASVLQFPLPERFCEMLRDAGFAAVCHRSLTLGICGLYVGEKPLQE